MITLPSTIGHASSQNTSAHAGASRVSRQELTMIFAQDLGNATQTHPKSETPVMSLIAKARINRLNALRNIDNKPTVISRPVLPQLMKTTNVGTSCDVIAA